MSDYQEEFWGDRGPSHREERATRQGDGAIALLTPLLEPDEALSILLADVWGNKWLGRVTIAISGQRVFVVSWNRQGRCRRTMVADRSSVSAQVMDGEGATVRIRASWGTIEVGGAEVSQKARAIAALLNRTSCQEEPDQ